MGLNDDHVDVMLAKLTDRRLINTDSWLEPAEIRRQAKRRRNRRRVGAIGVVIVVAVLVATIAPFGLGGRSQPNGHLHVAANVGPAEQLVSATAPSEPAPSAVLSQAVAQSEEQFSLSVLKSLSAPGPLSSNIVISPSSLSIALSMLELGAKGRTEAQIAKVLGSGHLTAEQQAAGWSALSAELAQAGTSDGIEVQSANSLWLQKGLAMDPTFMSDLSLWFASGVWQVNFAADPGGAVGALNAWVAKETQGHITTLFNPGAITSRTALVLANAVYFKAAWEQPFSGTTANGTFHLSAGATVSVPFMHTAVGGPLDVSASETSGVDAVQLPYKGGHFAALIIMPTSEPISQFSGSLTPAGLDHLVSGLAPTALDLTMPSLSLKDSHELISTLHNLGMKDAFGPSADLTGMGPAGLVVSDIVQKDTLDVSPWGTEASAATGIGISTAARRATMSLTIDHPFLFLIRDIQTGQILFEAQVANPGAG